MRWAALQVSIGNVKAPRRFTLGPFRMRTVKVWPAQDVPAFGIYSPFFFFVKTGKLGQVFRRHENVPEGYGQSRSQPVPDKHANKTSRMRQG